MRAAAADQQPRGGVGRRVSVSPCVRLAARRGLSTEVDSPGDRGWPCISRRRFGADIAAPRCEPTIAAWVNWDTGRIAAFFGLHTASRSLCICGNISCSSRVESPLDFGSVCGQRFLSREVHMFGLSGKFVAIQSCLINTDIFDFSLQSVGTFGAIVEGNYFWY